MYALSCLFSLGEGLKLFVFCSRKWWQFILFHLLVSLQTATTSLDPVWLDTHRKPQPGLWLADAPRGAVIVAPCLVMRALSLTGASGLARLLFLRNRNVHGVLPQTHTHTPSYCQCEHAGCHTVTHHTHRHFILVFSHRYVMLLHHIFSMQRCEKSDMIKSFCLDK